MTPVCCAPVLSDLLLRDCVQQIVSFLRLDRLRKISVHRRIKAAFTIAFHGMRSKLNDVDMDTGRLFLLADDGRGLDTPNTGIWRSIRMTSKAPWFKCIIFAAAGILGVLLSCRIANRLRSGAGSKS